MADRLTIYFTSDTHGYLYPTNFADDTPRAMGLFAMEFPKDGNTLVIDGGDTLQGSPLTYYCHAEGMPMPCARAMNALGYDYVTLGNHDFNYGRETVLAHLRALDAKCLCANVTDARGELPVAPYAVHTLANGLRVGLVGGVTSWVNRWERPENLAGLAVTDPFAAMRDAALRLRARVDVLIGLYHGGFEKDLDTGRVLSDTDENIAAKLCEELPFDILLTGHQHIPMAGITYRGTHVMQTPCNAAAYGRLTVDAAGGIRSELCAPSLPARVAPWAQALYADLNRWLDRPIGRLNGPLKPAGKLEMALHGSPIARLINRVQLAESGADISATALGNEVRGFEADVTVRDVVASYPYANTLVTLRVTGAVLRQALEQCATYFAVDAAGGVGIGERFLRPKAAHYNYDYYDGVTYTFDLRRPVGERVTSLTRGGVPIADGDALTLVTNSYRATGAGDFDMLAGCQRVWENQTEVSELLLNHLRAHALVDVPEQPSCTVILPDGHRA